MKPVKNLQTLELLISNRANLYDNQGHEINIVRYLYNRFYDILVDIQEGNIFYNPNDLFR